MIAQKLRVFLWICLANFVYYSATTEIPKECAFGTSDYNETLCIETCTKPANVNESYCSNVTKVTASTQNQPVPQEADDPVALSGIMTSTTRELIDFTTLEPVNLKISSAVSVEASLKTSAVASLCVLFFAYF